MHERKDHIILIGFMGSGKSTVGIKLSYRLQCPLFDTDKMIEKKEKRSISEIFEKEGENYFRAQETQLLLKLKEERAGQIFSVGGGTPLRAENRKLLRELGTVVYLKVSPETVYERLKGDTTRPLLQGTDPMEKIRVLLDERQKRYADAADIVITTDGKKPVQVVEEIVAALEGDRRRGENV
ncbi:MAG: shikimate kinase [Lachnospiraceae bacterium]|nr:shikimate kinase [Lachnospiraceae bacterium]